MKNQCLNQDIGHENRVKSYMKTTVVVKFLNFVQTVKHLGGHSYSIYSKAKGKKLAYTFCSVSYATVNPHMNHVAVAKQITLLLL